MAFLQSRFWECVYFIFAYFLTATRTWIVPLFTLYRKRTSFYANTFSAEEKWCIFTSLYFYCGMKMVMIIGSFLSYVGKFVSVLKATWGESFFVGVQQFYRQWQSMTMTSLTCQFCYFIYIIIIIIIWYRWNFCLTIRYFY